MKSCDGDTERVGEGEQTAVSRSRNSAAGRLVQLQVRKPKSELIKHPQQIKLFIWCRMRNRVRQPANPQAAVHSAIFYRARVRVCVQQSQPAGFRHSWTLCFFFSPRRVKPQPQHIQHCTSLLHIHCVVDRYSLCAGWTNAHTLLKKGRERERERENK